MHSNPKARVIRYLPYLTCLVLAAPAFAAQPPPVPNPMCPYTGSGQTGTCTMAVLPTTPLSPATQPKYVNELPQPVFYDPEPLGSFDYYEIFSRQIDLSLAGPTAPFGAANITPATTATVDTYGSTVPAYNKAWLGLCNPAVKLTKAGTCPAGSELGTEVWGYGQLNMGGGLLGAVAGKPVSTYPGMSFRATKGKPVKVMWINQLPDNHLFCKFPLDSNYPCGIDRSIMGMQAGVMTSFGSGQQPDNAMVVHLHGGEIPPDSDGFAELWFGNANSAAAYRAPAAAAGDVQNIDPHLTFPAPNGILAASDPLLTGLWNGNSTPTGDTSKTGVQSAFAPVLGSLIRPTGDSMIYNYPMVQDAATIWYHDHALAKTRVNVAAGPAGYFYVQDPVVDTALWGATPDAAAGYAFGNCTNTGIVSGLCRDVPIVLQDRSFNADGSINFPNGLGQATNKFNPLTPGPNPTIHPQWVPEYFGDHAVVNGVIWPKMTVERKPYRIRFLDGSNARCYVLSMLSQGRKTAATFNLIAGDQGYLPTPVVSPTLTICPGERYEAVIDFTNVPAGTVIDLVNTAGAPFPNGIPPQRSATDRFLASMMQFVVPATAVAPAPGTLPWAPPATWAAAVANVNTRLALFPHDPLTGALPATLPANVSRRTFVLNEVLDPVTLAPLRVQIDGKAFEDPVTETPKQGSIEYWDIANTTVDAHPMHLHLVQFKVVGRWTMNMPAYQAAGGFTVNAATGAITVNKAIDPMNYVIGAMRAPDPGEQGFKDTARSLPGELLRIVAKWDAGWAVAFDPANPTVPYYQDVTSGPYVWHCHIVDHEDNEMMRPTLVVK